MAQQDLLSDKKLGYLLELVLIQCITSRGTIQAPTTIPELLSFVDKHRELRKAVISNINDKILMDALFRFMNDAVPSTNGVLNQQLLNSSENYRELIGDIVLGSANGGNGTFDLETNQANLHVKLNQNNKGDRIIGFQKDSFVAGEVISGTKFGNAYVNITKTVMKSLKPNIIETIVSRLDKEDISVAKEAAKEAYELYTNPATGMPRKPRNMHGIPNSEHPFVITKSAIKECYKKFGFDRIFTDNRQLLAGLIVDDIRDRVFTPFEDDSKIVGFAKYTCGRDSSDFPIAVKLDIEIYTILNLDEVEKTLWVEFKIGTDKKQPYGVVWVNDDPQTDDNALFFIEFRTDGEGHPPQLKIGNPNKLHELSKYHKVS